MDEKSAVIKYEAPRVLRMDLTNQPQICHDGAYATNCTNGNGFTPSTGEENKRGKRDFQIRY